MADGYFDNAASTQPLPSVLEAFTSYLGTQYANPSSLHKKGIEASYCLAYAEQEILSTLGMRDGKVVFTSGATESANMAISGILTRGESLQNRTVLTTAIEHPCVSETCHYFESLGAKVGWIGTDENGQVDKQALLSAVDEKTALVSLIWVNNEFGAVQDIAGLSRAIKAKNTKTLIHVDAVQGYGKLKADFSNVDMVSISAHKFHAPKGIGALAMRKGITMKPLMHGGGQQANLRSGTINSPGIFAMAKASEAMREINAGDTLRDLGSYCYKELSLRFAPESFNSHKGGFDTAYAPHIFSLSFPGLKGEVLVHMMEEKGFYLSTASACSSTATKKNSPLLAIGADLARVEGTVRISLCALNTKMEISEMADCLYGAVSELSRIYGKVKAR